MMAIEAKAKSSFTVRHYCQGIGDCHLLRFTKDDESTFSMLIDCGLHSSVTNNRQTISRIAANIKAVAPKIDVVVATHEHWDHNSGFLTANDTFQKMFKEVWLGWTEDPKDKAAVKLDKYKDKARQALHAVNERLAAAPPRSAYMQGMKEGIAALSGFYFEAVAGKGRTVRDARNAVVALAPKTRYVEPEPKPITIPGMKNLRIYVLGPPRDEAMIRVTDRASEMYGLSLSRGHAVSTSLLNAAANYNTANSQDDDDILDPFDRNLGESLTGILTGTDGPRRGGEDANPRYTDLRQFIASHYGDGTSDPDKDWRRIDLDWAAMGADLAMQLDNRTNNTSVVLAFEFVDTGRVFLFAADAQIGSWLSWQELQWKVGDTVVTAQDLLKRTVYYKVGHHGSQNATAKSKGLELMNSPDFSAYIPTNQADALRVHWGAMPYPKLLTDLDSRAAKRVVRADDDWLKNGPIPDGLKGGCIKSVKRDRTGSGLWVEFKLS
jgi:hypothetical protein